MWQKIVTLRDAIPDWIIYDGLRTAHLLELLRLNGLA
jgi:hypothetical protein